MNSAGSDNLRAVICAAGDGTRWTTEQQRRPKHYGHLPARKHLVSVDGENLLERTTRLLRERGIRDVTITHPQGRIYPVTGAQIFEAPAGLPNNAGRLFTQPLWNPTGRTLMLWGDTYFTDAAIDRMVEPRRGWTLYARLVPSATKAGPEIFGVGFDPVDHERYAATLAELRDVKWSSWIVYFALAGLPFNSYSAKGVPDSPCVVPINDETEDFDFPQNYLKWMAHYRRNA